MFTFPEKDISMKKAAVKNVWFVFMAFVFVLVAGTVISLLIISVSRPGSIAMADNTAVPKFSAGDMVRTKVGGYVGQINLIAGTGGGINYDVRFTNPCGGGFLFDYVNMKEFEIEAVEVMEPNNDNNAR
jgi:hypothetical protein